MWITIYGAEKVIWRDVRWPVSLRGSQQTIVVILVLITPEHLKSQERGESLSFKNEY